MNDGVEKKNVEDTDDKVIDNIPESKLNMRTTALVEMKELDDHFLKSEDGTITGKTHDITEMTTEDKIVSYTLKPDLNEEEHTVEVHSEEADKSEIGYLENDKVEGSVDKKNKITLEKNFTIDTASEDIIKDEFMQTIVSTADPAVQHMGDVIQDDLDNEKSEGTANGVMVFNSEFDIDKHILTAEQVEDENDLTIKSETTTVSSQVNDVNKMTENRKPPCESETDANEHNNQDRIISSPENNEYEDKDLGNMKVEGVNENKERISEIDHQLNMIITEQLKEEKIDQTDDTEAQQFNENVDISKDDGTSDKISDGLYTSESEMQMTSVGEKVEHEITTKGDVEVATCPTNYVLMMTVEKQANESETDAHKQNDKHEYITEREAGETKIDEREAKTIEGVDAIQNVIFSDTERLNQTHNDSQATEDQKLIDEFEIMAYEHDSDSGSISNLLAQGTEIKQLENTNDEYTHDQDRILEEESQKVDMLTDKLEEDMQQTPDTESELNTIPKIEEMNDGMEKKNVEDTDEKVIDNIPEYKSDMQTTTLVEIKEHDDHFLKSEEWTLTGKTHDITEMTTEDKIVSNTLKPDLNEEEHTVEVLSEEADKSEIGYLENDKVEGSVDKKNEITLEKDFTIDTASDDKIKNEFMQTIVPTADPAVQHMGDVIQDDLDKEKSEGTANDVMVFNSEFEIDKHISTAEQVEDEKDLTIKSETTTVSSQINDVNEITKNKKPPCESETDANEHNNQDRIITNSENNEYEDKDLGNMKVEGGNENNERISEIDHQLNMIITEQLKEEKIDQTADTEAQLFNENVDITKDDGTSDKISDGLYASESEMQMTSVGEKVEHEITTKGDVEVATCPTNDVLMVTVEKQANESETDAHKQNDKHEYITEREAGETKIDEREAKTIEGVENVIFSDTERLNQTHNDSQATEDKKLFDKCEIMAYEHHSDSGSISYSLAEGTEIKQLENTNDEYTHDQDRILEEESQKVDMLTDKLEEDMQQTPDTESELNTIPKIEEMNDGVEKENVEDTDEKVIHNIPESKSNMQTTTLVEIQEQDDHFLKSEEWTLTGKTHDIKEMTTEDEIVSYTLKPDLNEEEHTVKVLSEEADKSEIGYLENDKVEGSVDKKNEITLEKDFTIDTAFEDKIKDEFMQTTVPTADPAVQHMGDEIQDDVEYEKAEGTANDVIVFNPEFEIDKHILTAEQVEDENDLTIKRETTTVRRQVNDVNEMTQNRKPPCESETGANEHNNQDRIISSPEINQYENKDLGNMKVEGVNENNERISEIDHQLNKALTEQLKEEKTEKTAITELQQVNENVDIAKDSGSNDNISDRQYASESEKQMTSVGEKFEHELTTTGETETATCPTHDVLMVTVEEQCNESETDAHKHNDKHEYITDGKAHETRIEERETRNIEGLDAVNNVCFYDTECFNLTHNDPKTQENTKVIDDSKIGAYEHDSNSDSSPNTLTQEIEFNQLENAKYEYIDDQDRILEQQRLKNTLLTEQIEDNMQQTTDTESELDTRRMNHEINDDVDKRKGLNVEGLFAIQNVSLSDTERLSKTHNDNKTKEDATLVDECEKVANESDSKRGSVSNTLTNETDVHQSENTKYEYTDVHDRILEQSTEQSTLLTRTIEKDRQQTSDTESELVDRHVNEVIKDGIGNENDEDTAESEIIKRDDDKCNKIEEETVANQTNKVETDLNEQDSKSELISSQDAIKSVPGDFENRKLAVNVDKENKRFSGRDYQLDMVLTEKHTEEPIVQTTDTEAEQVPILKTVEINEHVETNTQEGSKRNVIDSISEYEREFEMTSFGDENVENAVIPSKDVLTVRKKPVYIHEHDANEQDKRKNVTEDEVEKIEIGGREKLKIEETDALENESFSYNAIDRISESEPNMQMSPKGVEVEHELFTIGEVETKINATNDTLKLLEGERPPYLYKIDAHEGITNGNITEEEAKETKIGGIAKLHAEGTISKENDSPSDTERVSVKNDIPDMKEDGKLLHETATGAIKDENQQSNKTEDDAMVKRVNAVMNDDMEHEKDKGADDHVIGSVKLIYEFNSYKQTKLVEVQDENYQSAKSDEKAVKTQTNGVTEMPKYEPYVLREPLSKDENRNESMSEKEAKMETTGSENACNEQEKVTDVVEENEDNVNCDDETLEIIAERIVQAVFKQICEDDRYTEWEHVLSVAESEIGINKQDINSKKIDTEVIKRNEKVDEKFENMINTETDDELENEISVDTREKGNDILEDKEQGLLDKVALEEGTNQRDYVKPKDYIEKENENRPDMETVSEEVRNQESTHHQEKETQSVIKHTDFIPKVMEDEKLKTENEDKVEITISLTGSTTKVSEKVDLRHENKSNLENLEKSDDSVMLSTLSDITSKELYSYEETANSSQAGDLNDDFTENTYSDTFESVSEHHSTNGTSNMLETHQSNESVTFGSSLTIPGMMLQGVRRSSLSDLEDLPME
ncbi:uncharacterized protein LOC127863263 [Dreissena polymorpha]|uniref:uncharacterized protein LOC127863263 n=1 Tax=Dreissena polymorpha TaxID=45954 RepID=UPI00226411FA|nr:uncharacterized protein LOC127863263 [Dreissena polymorpha]